MMKTDISIRSIVRFAFFNLLFFTLCSGYSQKGLDVQKSLQSGARPPFSYDTMDVKHLKPSFIRVKFQKEYSGFLVHKPLLRNEEGVIHFGVADVDNLNQKYGVVQVRPSFYIALNNAEFSVRHKAHGLDLWYDLFVPSGTDVLQMIADYQGVSSIEISEGVIKKVAACWPPVGKPDTSQHDHPAFTPNDPRFGDQWSYNNTGQSGGTVDADIDLPEAWEINKGSSNVIVAVVDNGVQYTHPDLSGNMWSGRGWNFLNNTATINVGAHGTHVAGTISANTNNGVGVSGIAGGSGVGDGVRLMTCQIADGNWVLDGGYENAIVWSADKGAAISQNSWGYDVADVYEQIVLDAIDYFNENGGGGVMDGGLVIFAAGNSNSSGHFYPAYYNGCISVAATNHNDVRASYSTYNNGVDLSAPGGSANFSIPGILSTSYVNTYEYYQGTSMACPHVSGVAALILSLLPGQLTSAQVRTILLNSTDDISALNPSYSGMLGSGRLNANKALILAQTYANPSYIQPPGNLNANATSTSQINLSWSLNSSSDPVLLAYNTVPSFGTPSGSYSVGDAIAGGGTVIYSGSLTAYAHASLSPNTAYYYSIWSKNGSTYSTTTKRANDTTSATLPFTQSFSGTQIPANWYQQATGDTWYSWYVVNSNYAGGTAPELISYYQNMTNATTRIVSSPINTLGVSQLNLNFRSYIYDTDVDQTFKIQTSTNGITWTDEAYTLTTHSIVGPEIVSTTIDHNLNNLTTYIAFTVTGNLTYYFWVIDDIDLSTINNWVGGNLSAPNDWNVAANWSLNAVPDQNLSVKIPNSTSNPPHVTSALGSPANCRNLTIGTGSSITIDAGKALSAANVTNASGESGIVLESSVAGTASFICSNAPSATIKRYLTGNSSLTQSAYHQIAIPLQSNTLVSNLFLDSYLYTYNTLTQAWQNLGTSTTTPLNKDLGYLVYYPGNEVTYTYAGNLRSGALTLYTGSSSSGYFYLLPNPYTSAIDWDANLGWTKTNLYDATWIWNPVAKNYAAYGSGVGTNGATKYIPTGQSFFVRANSTSFGLSINPSARVHSTQPFFKDAGADSLYLSAKAVSRGGYDEILVRFAPSYSINIEGEDVVKRFGSEEAPQLFTRTPNQDELAIQALPMQSGAFAIPIDFKMDDETQVDLTFSNLDRFPSATTILLEDKLLDKIQNLKASPTYSFTHQKSNDQARFNLHINGLTGINPAGNILQVRVWILNGAIYLENLEKVNRDLVVELFTMLGQPIQSCRLNLDRKNKITTVYKGLVIVRITTSEGVTTIKGVL